MESTEGRKDRFVMGRLKTVASRNQRRGHTVTVSSGGRTLGTAKTDSSGRFLLEWPGDESQDRFLLRLLDSGGGTVESVELKREDLLSPPVVAFRGDSVIESRGSEPYYSGSDGFEADGDFPLCIASSCQPVKLTWTAPAGSTVSIVSGGTVVGEKLEARGTIEVLAERTTSYTRRAVLTVGSEAFSDMTVEVRRYPALSLVVQDGFADRGSEVEFGASTSCPAGPDGLSVTVLTSDGEVVPQFGITVPAGLTWGTTAVRLGAKPGRVKIVATAPGYARDGVTMDVR